MDFQRLPTMKKNCYNSQSFSTYPPFLCTVVLSLPSSSPPWRHHGYKYIAPAGNGLNYTYIYFLHEFFKLHIFIMSQTWFPPSTCRFINNTPGLCWGLSKINQNKVTDTWTLRYKIILDEFSNYYHYYYHSKTFNTIYLLIIITRLFLPILAVGCTV